jgi:hypothetical protein
MDGALRCCEHICLDLACALRSVVLSTRVAGNQNSDNTQASLPTICDHAVPDMCNLFTARLVESCHGPRTRRCGRPLRKVGCRWHVYRPPSRSHEATRASPCLHRQCCHVVGKSTSRCQRQDWAVSSHVATGMLMCCLARQWLGVVWIVAPPESHQLLSTEADIRSHCSLGSKVKAMR